MDNSTYGNSGNHLSPWLWQVVLFGHPPFMKDGLLLSYTQLGSIAPGNFIGYLSLAIIGEFLAARFGIVACFIPTIMAAASGEAIGKNLASAGLGFITLFFGIGQALGPLIGGWIKDTTGTFTWAFFLAACVSLIGAAGSLCLRKSNTE